MQAERGAGTPPVTAETGSSGRKVRASQRGLDINSASTMDMGLKSVWTSLPKTLPP